MIDRRAVLKAAGALATSAAGAGTAEQARAAAGGLMRPERLEGYPLPPVKTATIEGGKVTYALAGPANGPLVLYFHGWGDDYRVVLPLEYGLTDAGFRLLVPHRPGYAGTTLDWVKAGKTLAWRTASDTADVAARLLDQLQGQSSRPVAVIGMSGGAPAALAFASRHPSRTAALLIQAGVTRPWTDAKYVPELLRGEYTTAFERFGWAGDRVSQAMFGLLVKLRENFFSDEDKVGALAGARLADAKLDPAYQGGDRAHPQGRCRQQGRRAQRCAQHLLLQVRVLRLGEDRGPDPPHSRREGPLRPCSPRARGHGTVAHRDPAHLRARWPHHLARA